MRYVVLPHPTHRMVVGRWRIGRTRIEVPKGPPFRTLPKRNLNKRDTAMKKLICLAAALILLSSVGCANRPIRDWFRGAACNTCQPPLHPSTGSLGTCVDGCANPSAIPNPIIQPGQATISGDLIESSAPGQSYYPNGDPTTQGYGIQPQGSGVLGPIPQPNGF